MTGVNGARTIKRQRRTKAAVEQLERQILEFSRRIIRRASGTSSTA